MNELEEMKKRKDVAYWERQQMVAALTHVYPSFLTKHPAADTEWQDDWRTIVVIILPQFDIGEDEQEPQPRYRFPGSERVVQGMQITWHIHDFDVPLFDHLPREIRDNPQAAYVKFEYIWDGHDTEEKYKRLRDYSRVVEEARRRGQSS